MILIKYMEDNTNNFEPLVVTKKLLQDDKNKFKKRIIDESNKKEITIDYSRLCTTDVSLYSSTMPWHIDKIFNIYKEHLPEIRNFKKIVDGTANIGVDTFHFAKNTDAKLLAVEIDPDEFQTLNRNVKHSNFGNKIEPINASIYDVLNVIDNVDMVYLDPPWGGPDYVKESNIMLYLDNKPIYHIINLIFREMVANYVVMKSPFNLDKEEVCKHLGNGIKIDIYKIDSKIDLIIFRKK